MPESNRSSRYRDAQQQYADLGVDADVAIASLLRIPISLHCWQGDDINGFEDSAESLGGGLAVTGNYPGRARSADELRQDLELVLSLVPGQHRVNLHAIYGEFGGARVDRDAITPDHFSNWIAWAKSKGVGLDFNPSFFKHPLAADGVTLSSHDESTRTFWINHGIACRKIGEAFGRETGSPCVTNFWIPDGSKDTPADRVGPRARLLDSLDRIFARPIDAALNLDAVEGKLFGLGSESFVVGSHDFYLAYALSRGKLLCLDAGHYHPTESLADKVSSVLAFAPRVLLHVSRGVRWDSDHVVTLGDELLALALELKRGDFFDRVHIGLDFFDATINRVAAWVIGTRAMQKALLAALLEPTHLLQQFERDGDFTRRLALMEDCKTLPLGAIWREVCERQQIDSDFGWMRIVDTHHAKRISSSQ